MGRFGPHECPILIIPSSIASAPVDGKIASDAMRGLLLAMGMSRRANDQAPQPVRGHLFFHNLENLWVCSNPACNDPGCNPAVREAEQPRPTCGALHPHHRLTCSCGARVLDLVICSSCGEVFFAGFSKIVTLGQQTAQVLTPDQPNLERLPDQAGWDRRHKEYAVFWPCADESGSRPLPARRCESSLGTCDT